MTTQRTRTAASAATARPQGAYARVKGVETRYESHGAGHPLVLPHGGVLTLGLSFGAMIPTLAATHRVIAAESQGQEA